MLALIAFLLFLILMVMVFRSPGARNAVGVLILAVIVMHECAQHDHPTTGVDQCNVENNNCGRGWK